jgi:hypothetical protein
VVSATGTYLDVPDDAVLRVAPGPTNPAELAVRLQTILDDPELAARMGEAARRHQEDLAASGATAAGYAEAIEATLELVGDPAHKAMAIWGKALADMGVGEEQLQQGLGLDYARGLEAFRGSP